MGKIKLLFWGILSFIPILYLADGVSLVGTFTTNTVLNWVFVFSVALTSIPLLILIDSKVQKKFLYKESKHSTRFRYLLLPIIWAIFIVVLNLILNNLSFIPHFDENFLQSETARLLSSPLRWPMIFAICLFGPICEELAFRGVMEHYLTRILNYWLAVLVTNFIFALLHTENIISSLCLFTFAVGLSVLNKKSGTLKTSIIAHIFYNAIVTGMVMIQL